MPYVPLRKAVEFLGLHPHTLRKYADEGKIESIKNNKKRHATRATTVCYCRVSSSKQRDDLLRQIAFMQELYPDAEIIQDIGNNNDKEKTGVREKLATFCHLNSGFMVLQNKLNFRDDNLWLF
jgi:predicted site-specific integrase-resolvase